MSASPETLPPIRVAMICHDGQLYGAQQSLLQLLTTLTAKNDLIRAWVSMARAQGPLEQELARLPHVNVTHHARLPWFQHDVMTLWRRGTSLLALLINLPLRLPKLIKTLHAQEIQLVHTNSVVSLEGALAARFLKIPHVWHCRELFIPENPKLVPLLGQKLTRYLIPRLSDRVVCISEAVQRQFLPLPPALAAKLVVIENPVALAEAFIPESSKPSLSEICRLGYVGRMSSGKRFLDLIDALSLVVSAGETRWTLTIAGTFADPAYETLIQERIEELGLSDSIHWMGFVYPPASVYAQIDALVLTSANEAFGRVLVEAMRAGVPCIATEAGGVPEVITHEQTGWLYAPGDLGQLATILQEVIASPLARERMARRAKAMAQSRFLPERHAQSILSLYQNLLNPSPRLHARRAISLPHLMPHLALLLVALTFGAFPMVVKLLLPALPEWPLGMWRLLLPGVLMIVLERFWIKTPIARWQDAAQMMGLGMVGMWFVQLASVFGVKYTSTFHASLLMATIPLFTLALGLLLPAKGDKPKAIPQKLLGMTLGFSGVVLMLSARPSGINGLPETFLLGDSLLMLNAVAFAWFLLQNQPFLKKYPPFTVTAYCYAGAVLATILLSLGGSLHLFPVPGVFELFEALKHLSWADWGWLMYLVFPASIMNYTLTNYALKRTSADVVSAYVFIQPVVAAMLGFFVLQEPITLMMVASGAMVGLGLMLVCGMWPSRGIVRHESV